ncbi:MAG: maleylacetoacetate isomerase [Steroidobacteraceae bacterium]|jgi:maleylpyruvate isomerase|nr:maleylacetoacetate isomerase [Steroidobacteraceae bacterium]
MRLHGYWRSSAAYRVRIALRLKGLEAEGVHHALPRGEHRAAEYLALNPQGLVPALETEAGVLVQSSAIIEYLEERWPRPPLLPADPGARAVVRGMAGIVCADIHPINNLRVLNRLRSEYRADEAAIARWVNHWIREGFTALEAQVRRYTTSGRHCFGDGVTVADVCLVPQLYNARRFGCDLGDFPTLLAIDAHCRSLDAFRLAEPEAQPDAAG